MAREFNGSSQYLECTTPVLTAVPMTMAAWFNTTTVSGNHNIIGIGGENGTVQQWRMGITGDDIFIQVQNNTAVNVIKANVVSTNTWHHGCGVFGGNNSRAVYIDGGNKLTNTAIKTPNPAQIERMRIGLDPNDLTTQWWSGMIAEAVIWNAALSDEEVATLALGFSPLLVRPQNIVSYVPLIRDNDEDLITGLSWTPVGSPTISAHPRVFYPGMQSHLQSGSGSATANPFGPLIQVT